MQQQSSPRRKRRFGKFLLVTFGVLAGLGVAAHLIWKYSGDGVPQLVVDEDGIKVYKIKKSGSSLYTIKATRVVDTSMDKAVSAMLDGSLENCADWNPNCYVSRVVEPWDAKTSSYLQLWTQKMGSMLKPREFLLRVNFSQDPQTRSATVQFKAEPDKLPPDDCCVRLSHMQSRWQFTPTPDGKVGVELLMDIDVGVPYFLFNAQAPNNVHWTFENLPRLFNQPRYDNAKVDWLLTSAAAP
ncbi:START domain-containing protein [Tahibacter caeni]|uniref:START domain-containing protein n=1 Tax=Tahibacter caeni TaxID=1453545 RepID=UPI002148ABB4|nr:START domain-containing protein [Tahibacter caeni]